MLTEKLFKPHEPRNVYPVFADCDNRVGYVFRDTYVSSPRTAIRFAAKSFVKRDHRTPVGFLSRVVLDSFRGIEMRFRGAFLDRDGKLLATFPEFARIRYLEGFDVSVNDLLAAQGIPLQDGQFLVIADRGLKLDTGFSTGTLSATYLNDHTFTCYRNSIFARPVNELTHHRPQGFRSIAPHMFVSDELESSALFCNFSSDPRYSETANPKVKLYRNEREFLEADFGPIPAFGAAEKSMSELFGKGVKEYLKASSGSGTLIAEQTGITLSSIHLIRNRKTGSMSIEHTRPTHMYVL